MVKTVGILENPDPPVFTKNLGKDVSLHWKSVNIGCNDNVILSNKLTVMSQKSVKIQSSYSKSKLELRYYDLLPLVLCHQGALKSFR